jgi:di/tricarboxylate transporter
MDYIYVFITLFLVLILFVWGKFRHDIVALLALFTLVLLKIIPPDKAFAGFGHPAVITVAVVLIIGKALENSGLIDVLGKWVTKVGNNLTIQIFTLSLLVVITSAFMNNVGALAILMPIALNIASKGNNPPSYFLMPIAFASLLGGMTTLIGTPPNIIIATLRADETGEAFGMFAFAPVGLGLTFFGVLFITLLGWRLLPKRTARKSQIKKFQIDDYFTEVKVTKNSMVKNLTFGELNKNSKADVQILGLVRKNQEMQVPDDEAELLLNDIILLESNTEELKTFVSDTGVELVGGRKFRKDATGVKNISIIEVVVMDNSPLIGQTSAGLKMRSRYGVNLLAVSRAGKKIQKRLDQVVFRTGDVILLQGRTLNIEEAIRRMGCLPLEQRGLRIDYKRKITLALSIFIASVLVVMADILPVQIAFSLAALGLVLTGVLPLKEVYTSIDWPVIVLLGAMLPVGEALESSGGAELIAAQILSSSGQMPVGMSLGILLTATMLLSGVINNAATVVLMAPIAIDVAKGMNLSIDPFLMTIAIGASASFLTPIGHQSNTLVMGPGGYQFGDYFRMGFPLSVLVVVIAVPLILYFWPV